MSYLKDVKHTLACRSKLLGWSNGRRKHFWQSLHHSNSLLHCEKQNSLILFTTVIYKKQNKKTKKNYSNIGSKSTANRLCHHPTANNKCVSKLILPQILQSDTHYCTAIILISNECIPSWKLTRKGCGSVD